MFHDYGVKCDSQLVHQGLNYSEHWVMIRQPILVLSCNKSYSPFIGRIMWFSGKKSFKWIFPVDKCVGVRAELYKSWYKCTESFKRSFTVLKFNGVVFH